MSQPTTDTTAVQEYYSPGTQGFYRDDLHTTMPEDVVPVTAEYKAALLEGEARGMNIAPPDADHALPYLADPPPPTLEAVLAGFENNIQSRLDTFARTLTYDSMMSACTYATSTIPMYRIEGQYCVDARDATWAKAYELMQAIQPRVQAGGAIPSWEDIEAQLPPLVWPEGSRGYGS